MIKKELIEEVKEDMCDNYCKYSLSRNEFLYVDGKKVMPKDYYFGYEDICDKCPLNRL